MRHRIRMCFAAVLLLLSLCVFFAGCKGGSTGEGAGAEPPGQEQEPDSFLDDRGSDIEMPEIPIE